MEINRDPISKWPKRAVKTVSPENLREQPIREQFHPPSNFQLLFVLKVIAYSFKKFLLKEDSLILGFYGWSVIFFKQFYCKILIQIPVLGIDIRKWNEYYAKHWRRKKKGWKIKLFFDWKWYSWFGYFTFLILFFFHSYINIIYSYKIFNITIQECHKITSTFMQKRQ